MNHADLSRELALAIGYHPESVRIDKKHDLCEVYGAGAGNPRCMRLEWTGWEIFDYRWPDVALPLLKWLAQPYGRVGLWPNEESWSIRVGNRNGDPPVMALNADTLEEAIARACIAVGGK